MSHNTYSNLTSSVNSLVGYFYTIKGVVCVCDNYETTIVEFVLTATFSCTNSYGSTLPVFRMEVS